VPPSLSSWENVTVTIQNTGLVPNTFVLQSGYPSSEVFRFINGYTPYYQLPNNNTSNIVMNQKTRNMEQVSVISENVHGGFTQTQVVTGVCTGMVGGLLLAGLLFGFTKFINRAPKE